MIIEKEISRVDGDGSFYIDLRRYSMDVYLKFLPWEKGMSIFRWDPDSENWQLEEEDPDIPLIVGFGDEHKNLPVVEFIKNIPADVISSAGMFDYLQTTLLQWAARMREARDLLIDLPIMAWMIADAAVTDHFYLNKGVRELLGKKRKEILKRLLKTRFSNADVKFIKKIHLLNGTKDELSLIKKALVGRRLAQDLSHWEIIPVHLIAILLRYPELTGTKLIRQFGLKNYSQILNGTIDALRIRRVWEDSLNMGELLVGKDNAIQALSRCSSADEIQKLHDRWMNRFNRLRTATSAKPFPEPPIPGSFNIQPIKTEKDLLAEGRRMDHCVGGYTKAVRAGSCYIYEVKKPERATLEIKIKGGLRIGEFRLAFNRRPSNKSWIAVMKWLEEHKQNLKK